MSTSTRHVTVDANGAPPASTAPHRLGGRSLDAALEIARCQGRAALAAYMPAGYPTVARSAELLLALAQHVDVLEVGIPFSDPMLDGPVIQEASAQALAAGFRMRDLFALIDIVSCASAAALLVMSYWQPIARYGPDRFAAELTTAGGAGVVLPDLPIEEAGPWLRAARAHRLATVFVVAPNAADARLGHICAAGSGMVYAPAAPGVTGSGHPIHPSLSHFVRRLRSMTDLPVAVGIGVSNPDQAYEISSYADCVVVGSALIHKFRQATGPRPVNAVTQLACEFSQAITRRPTDTPPHEGLA